MRIPAIPAAAAALTIGLGACGSSGSNHGVDSPAATVKTYLTALANGDGATACNALAPALQSQELKLAGSQGIKASSCSNLISQVRGHLTSAQRSLLVNAKVTSVTVHGSTATVTLKGASHPPTLTKIDGKWLITGGITGG